MRSNSELKCHIAKCRVWLYWWPWKISWNNALLDVQSLSEYIMLNDMTIKLIIYTVEAEKHHDNWKTDTVSAADKAEATDMLSVSDTEEPINLFDRLTSSVSDTEQMHKQTTYQQSQCGLLSISSSIWVKTFQEATDCSADAVQISDTAPDCQTGVVVFELSNKSENKDYLSFHNSIDYSWVLWLHNNHTTKKSVNVFFKNPQLNKMHSHLSFKNTDQWLDQLHEISYDISQASKKQKWTLQTFKIESAYDGGTDCEYVIQYQSIIDTLHFLLSHKPFDDDMIYASIHHYNSDEKWVYSELHTEDWWWQTQKKLSNGATVVPLLIFTDKTILTQHQGDLSVWSVYLTIENLNQHTRRAQSRPGLVLLDFLSVIENDDDNIKSRVWHMVLFIILDCKLSSWSHVPDFPTDNKQQSDSLSKMNLI